VLIPTPGHRRTGSSSSRPESSESAMRSNVGTPTATNVPFNPKTATRADPRPETLLRYRRRCAPILLYHSPRASDVIILNGERVRVDSRKPQYLPFTELPPRYEAHKFPRAPEPEPAQEETPTATEVVPVEPPAQPEVAEEGNTSDEQASSSATTAGTPATTAPPSLLRGRSEESLFAIQPISETVTRVGSCESGEIETPPVPRNLRQRASSGDLLANTWRNKFFGLQKSKRPTSAAGPPPAQQSASRPGNTRKTSDFTKMTEEETADVARNMNRMGLLL
jgi:hypothetical protein